MSWTRQEQLRRYADLIARKHGGLEGLRDVISNKLPRREAGGLESLPGGPDRGRVASAAAKAVESFERNREPLPPEMDALEAIIDAEIRPVMYVVDGKFTSTHPLWTQLSTDAALRARIEACMPSIGRLELPGHPRLPYGGTAFVVGDGLVMTNRHVAEIFASGLGNRSLMFKPGAQASIDFLREHGRTATQAFAVRRIVMIHPYWDMALLAVDGLGSRNRLKLSLVDSRDIRGHDIAVIGYPAFDARNPTGVQQTLFDGRYGVKRLQPGELQGGMKTASFGKLVDSATHDCSTLGGNSGSAVIDLDTGEVLALHFGGRYREQNYAVPTFELARDGRILDSGVQFAGIATTDGTAWADWWQRADEHETSAGHGSSSMQRSVVQPAASSSTSRPFAITANADGSVSMEVPIHLTFSIGTRANATAPGPSTELMEDALEAMREPWRDTDYASRDGYDPDFLNASDQVGVLPPVRVPMPLAADSTVLARTLQGDEILHYQNFSIRMHAKRRLALVTACNVTREPALRRPEPGKDYTRKGLSGLGERDQERWFLDPRMAAEFQIPDVFFTKDRKAFDKGHIVRRDDVAWGTTYDELRRANGDSYHVSNCSPQVAGFNQSSKGEDNWGDLENHVLSEAANERLCVFGGPVLRPDDRIFHGVAGGGKKLRARIPERFWKVIVARVEDGIAAYGFVLEQDLTDVAFEFTVAEEFAPAMYPIADIEAMTGVAFDPVILAADQYDSVRGTELVYLRGIPRRRA